MDSVNSVAINPKYQTKVNAFVRWNEKYDALVDSSKEESKAGDNAYEKAKDNWDLLPKREQANIAKHIEHVQDGY